MSPLFSSHPAIPIRREAERIFGLDLLRAAAILSVVCAHGFVVLYPHFGPALGVLGHGGFYGVELFFVLSGFLIGQLLIRKGEELRDPRQIGLFYLRRWFRTLPLFFLFLLVNVWFERQFREHAVNPSEALSHAFFLRNFATLRLTFFPESWSLAVEEWFYLLFPALLWVILRMRRRFDEALIAAAAFFLLLSTVLRMVHAHDGGSTWTESQRMVVLLRFDALMIGILAAWLSLRAPALWNRWRALAAVTGGLVLLAMYATLWKIQDHQLAFGDDNYFARTFRFTVVSLGFALLLPWASTWRLEVENAGSRTIRRIALWSYALYLVHLPFFDFVVRKIFPTTATSALRAISCFTVELGGAIVLSALLHHFYEAPWMRLRDRRLAPTGSKQAVDKRRDR
ncbi:MAG: acyltransferase family protein [Chthoniobacterales bacterium]